MSAHPVRSRQYAFTLVELLVVIAIIGVIASILFPVVAKVRASAHATHCRSNLQQLGRAFTLYAQDNRSLLPAPVNTATDTMWFEPIHPYAATKWDRHTAVDAQLAGVFLCPTWSRADHVPTRRDIGFAMNAGLGAAVDRTRPVPISSLQRPTRTVLLLEIMGTDAPCFPGSGTLGAFATEFISSFEAGGCDRHEGAANYLFADGHVGHHTPSEVMNLLL